MNNVVYDHIGKVLFQKDNIGTICRYVKEFEDSYDEITIVTDVEIGSVERGWLGDITYWAAGGWHIAKPKLTDLTSEPVFIKDALCIRVGVKAEQGCPVEWIYTFFKY
jgi:hypothetical protein